MIIEHTSLKQVPVEDFAFDILDEFAIREPSCLSILDKRTWFDKFTSPLVDWFLRRVDVRVTNSTNVLVRFKEWNQEVIQGLPLLTILVIGTKLAENKVDSDAEGNEYIRINPDWHKNPLYFRVDNRFKDKFNLIVLKTASTSFHALNEFNQKGSPVARALSMSLRIFDDKEEAIKQKAQMDEFKSKLTKATDYLSTLLGTDSDDNDSTPPPPEDKRTLH